MVSPITSYDLLVPRQIVFGWGRRRELGALVQTAGRRALVVWGSRTLASHALGGELRDCLAASVEVVEAATITREPEVEDVDRLVGELRERGAAAGDVLVAIGGGSAIDLAKAAAALVPQSGGGSVRDYLEGVGRGLSLIERPLPMVAVPTTAGTGSEATKNAVISSFDPPFKKSLRSNQMLPAAVLVDPELTTTAPRSVTLHSGMDAITQLIESYISCRARPIPQALSRAGLRVAVPALRMLAQEPDDRAAREAMAHAALLSGIALANSGLGVAHGVAAALGVVARVPHGLACAVVLPVALRVNRAHAEVQYAELAAELGLDARSPAAAADAFVRHIQELCAAVGIPRRLSALAVRREQLAELARLSRGNSLDGNPRKLADAELLEILEEAL
jgi:alcohol dehydrogenase class IV